MSKSDQWQQRPVSRYYWVVVAVLARVVSRHKTTLVTRAVPLAANSAKTNKIHISPLFMLALCVYDNYYYANNTIE